MDWTVLLPNIPFNGGKWLRDEKIQIHHRNRIRSRFRGTPRNGSGWKVESCKWRTSPEFKRPMTMKNHHSDGFPPVKLKNDLRIRGVSPNTNGYPLQVDDSMRMVHCGVRRGWTQFTLETNWCFSWESLGITFLCFLWIFQTQHPRCLFQASFQQPRDQWAAFDSRRCRAPCARLSWPQPSYGIYGEPTESGTLGYQTWQAGKCPINVEVFNRNILDENRRFSIVMWLTTGWSFLWIMNRYL